MNSCPQPAQLLTLSLGTCTPGERERWENHLAECDTCTQTVTEERQLKEALGHLVCPPAQTLACFVDDALPPAELDHVAGHVVRCHACEEVVGWTREAQRAQRARPRRTVGRPRQAGSPPLWAATAAAAAVLLLALFLLSSESPTEPTQARRTPPLEERSPRVSPPVSPLSPVELESPNPSETQTPPPLPSSSPQPVVVEPTSGTSTSPDPEPSPSPLETPAPPESLEGTEAQPTLSVACWDGALGWRSADGSEGELHGPAQLAPGTRLQAKERSTLVLGDHTLSLPKNATLSLLPSAADSWRVELHKGEAFVSAGESPLEIRHGEAAARPGSHGSRFSLQAVGANRIFLCVVDGAAELSTPAQGLARIEAGQAARIDSRGKLRRVRTPTDSLAQAQEQATLVELATGLDVPRHTSAVRALRQLDPQLRSDNLREQAWAVYALEALRAAPPRLARLGAALAGPARERQEALLARDAGELVRSGALGPLLLSLLARAPEKGESRRVEGQLKSPLSALWRTLAEQPPAELAQDLSALLALRSAERALGKKTPQAVWSAVQATSHDASSLAGLLLARRRVIAAGFLSQLDNALAADPFLAQQSGGQLWTTQLALVLAGEATPKRQAQLLAHAATSPDQDAAQLLLFLSRDIEGQLGQRKDMLWPAHASVVARHTGSAYRVTFVFPSKKRAREAFLAGSWDGWLETSTPLRLRPDGSYTATLTLPPGRHEYKAIFDSTWEHDAENPLSAASGVDQTLNSVLLLD